MDQDDDTRRAFGHLKNKALAKLGAVKTTNVFLGILYMVVLVTVMTWVMFHPIYLKTGTPVFKYGLSMVVLGPFYLIWAVFNILSVYLLKKKA